MRMIQYDDKLRNGYEALRQIVLAIRPNNNNRGLALPTAASRSLEPGCPREHDIW